MIFILKGENQSETFVKQLAHVISKRGFLKDKTIFSSANNYNDPLHANNTTCHLGRFIIGAFNTRFDATPKIVFRFIKSKCQI